VTRGVVDELRFWVNPFVWGDGQRPFGGRTPVELALTGTTAFDTGIVRLDYRPVS
jgi:RibD C-terminal domain